MTPMLIAFAAQAAIAPETPSKTQVAAASELDKPICKRSAATGSYVRSQKVCLTKRQWRRVADDAQELGRSMRPGLTTGAQ